jgi:ABC-type transport system involved in multi-copper enzyme maturation permease subunit
MNTSLVRQLVLKDWYFQRLTIGGYTAGGLIGLAIVCLGTNASFFVGTIVLITCMIAIGIHLAVTTVVGERTEQTLPFIMSLPISPREYTAAKIVANLSIFLLPWLTLTAGALLILSAGGARANAMIPFATLTLTYILTSYLLVLAVAIVTESQGWTLCTMGITNLFLQFFLYWVSHLPTIASGLKGPGAVWDRVAMTVLVVELALCAAFITLAFVFQARKRDFL